MASLILSDYAITALANDSGLNSLLDGGNMFIYDGVSDGPDAAANGTLLVTFALPPAANNTPANGVLTLDTIANANGVANGNAGYARFTSNADANVIGDGDCGTSGNTVVFDNVNIAVNQVVSVSSANFTVPDGS